MAKKMTRRETQADFRIVESQMYTEMTIQCDIKHSKRFLFSFFFSRNLFAQELTMAGRISDKTK